MKLITATFLIHLSLLAANGADSPVTIPPWRTPALEGKFREALRSVATDGLTGGEDAHLVASLVILGLQSADQEIVSVALECIELQPDSWIG